MIILNSYKGLFPVDNSFATPSVVILAEEYDIDINSIIEEHASGRAWNHDEVVKTLTPEELEEGYSENGEGDRENSIAIVNRCGRVLTVHIIGGSVIWAITEGLFTEEQYTIIMLREEY